jgi:ubiquinone/menaquinone biosynthesis C-methylase UbiE
VSRPAERYTHGHHASVVRRHQQRTAERDAAYLLPHLAPGMRLLDAGCGPGTITAGLARAVAPGEAVGVDRAAEVLELARAHASEAGITNVRFEQADVYDLPYADASFDVIHAHQVLQHLADPVAALVEMGRVLRPGGVLGVRDADYGTMSAWPRSEAIDRWLRLYHAVAEANGADADAGRRLPSWLRDAGLEVVAVTASVETFVERAAIADWGYSWAERVTRSAFAEQAVEYGLATTAKLESIAEGWRAWADAPDAFFMFVHVECVARRRTG